MPRDGSGNFTLPANTQAVSGDPISSTKYNTLVQDLEADANVDRPIAAGGTGASTAAAARTNLGLVIGTDVQAFDAALLSIAGLTTTADRGIYTTASDTYAVYTLTAAGRAILDDADASAQRTTLGLGTAATVNTGTSGATIPLLNAQNTFSAAQTFSASFNYILHSGNNTTEAREIRGEAADGFGRAGIVFGTVAGGTGSSSYLEFVTNTYGVGRGARVYIGPAGEFTCNGNTVWHAGNDGAGSGLDADTLDGLQASVLVQTSGAQTVGGVKTLTDGLVLGTGTHSYVAGVMGFSDTNQGFLFRPPRVGALYAHNFQSFAGSTLFSITDAGAAEFSGTLRARTTASTETTGTLTVASANETIQATGDITIPNAVFSAGDIILIYAGASARTITQGASVTMRLGGTATTGSRTLAARGVAMLFFVSSSEVIVSGGAVT